MQRLTVGVSGQVSQPLAQVPKTTPLAASMYPLCLATSSQLTVGSSTAGKTAPRQDLNQVPPIHSYIKDVITVDFSGGGGGAGVTPQRLKGNWIPKKVWLIGRRIGQWFPWSIYRADQRRGTMSNFINNTFHIWTLGLMTFVALSYHHPVHAQDCKWMERNNYFGVLQLDFVPWR